MPLPFGEFAIDCVCNSCIFPMRAKFCYSQEAHELTYRTYGNGFRVSSVGHPASHKGNVWEITSILCSPHVASATSDEKQALV